MTDKQINAAIHKALGNPKGCPRCDCDECAYNKGLNYCNDLNALHEAEKGLDGVTEWIGEEHNGSAEEAWITHLCAVIARDANQRVHDDWLLVHATARQRAEAFLLTLGKWSATDKESLTVGATDKESLEVQGAGWPPGTRISRMNADGKWEEVQE